MRSAAARPSASRGSLRAVYKLRSPDEGRVESRPRPRSTRPPFCAHPSGSRSDASTTMPWLILRPQARPARMRHNSWSCPINTRRCQQVGSIPSFRCLNSRLLHKIRSTAGLPRAEAQPQTGAVTCSDHRHRTAVTCASWDRCLVDAADFVHFTYCLTGPNSTPQPPPPATGANCVAALDGDHDGDVDLRDLAGFQTAFGQP